MAHRSVPVHRAHFDDRGNVVSSSSGCLSQEACLLLGVSGGNVYNGMFPGSTPECLTYSTQELNYSSEWSEYAARDHDPSPELEVWGQNVRDDVRSTPSSQDFLLPSEERAREALPSSLRFELCGQNAINGAVDPHSAPRESTDSNETSWSAEWEAIDVQELWAEFDHAGFDIPEDPFGPNPETDEIMPDASATVAAPGDPRPVDRRVGRKQRKLTTATTTKTNRKGTTIARKLACLEELAA
ncbi:hypothetical protein HDU98_005018, partial [Podochytrium sp. JEL0797]